MRKAILLISLLLVTNVFAESDPTGRWNTFDENGNLLSTVVVKIEDAKLYANIVAVHTPGDKNPLCDQCKGDLYGQPVIGMEIINGLTRKKVFGKRVPFSTPKPAAVSKVKSG